MYVYPTGQSATMMLFREMYDPRVLAEGVELRAADAGAKAVEVRPLYSLD